MELGRLGVWSSGLRAAQQPAVLDAAAELEALGYGAIWFPAGRGTRAFEIGSALLAVTNRIAVATGIVSVWETTPEQATTGFAELEAAAGGRFLLGLGVSHGPLVDKSRPNRYGRPLATMREYLDALDAAAHPVPGDRRIIAALGPKMLSLAVERSLGTHTYLGTTQMTAALREQAGDALIAPEQAVILEPDAQVARATAREFLRMYLALPNYVNSWLRAGYQPADIEHGGSDRLVDDLVAWGNLDEVSDRVRAQYAAGADHVCLQVLGADPLPLAQWRELAAALVQD